MLLYAVSSAVYSYASVAGDAANGRNTRTTLGTVDCWVHRCWPFILVYDIISSGRTRVLAGVYVVALIASGARHSLAFVRLVTGPRPSTDGEVLSPLGRHRRIGRLPLHEISGNVYPAQNLIPILRNRQTNDVDSHQTIRCSVGRIPEGTR